MTLNEIYGRQENIVEEDVKKFEAWNGALWDS